MLSDLRRDVAGAFADAAPPRRAGAVTGLSVAAAPSEVARPERRPDTEALVEGPAEDDPSAAPDPADPADPVVSANAIGIAAAADPIPNATANAPTRPTNQAEPAEAPSEPDTARRRYSMERTRPRCTRR